MLFCISSVVSSDTPKTLTITLHIIRFEVFRCRIHKHPIPRNPRISRKKKSPSSCFSSVHSVKQARTTSFQFFSFWFTTEWLQNTCNGKWQVRSKMRLCFYFLSILLFHLETAVFCIPTNCLEIISPLVLIFGQQNTVFGQLEQQQQQQNLGLLISSKPQTIWQENKAKPKRFGR